MAEPTSFSFWSSPMLRCTTKLVPRVGIEPTLLVLETSAFPDGKQGIKSWRRYMASNHRPWLFINQLVFFKLQDQILYVILRYLLVSTE